MQGIHQTSKIKIRGKREKRREKVEIRSEFRIIEMENGYFAAGLTRRKGKIWNRQMRFIGRLLNIEG